MYINTCILIHVYINTTNTIMY